MTFCVFLVQGYGTYFERSRKTVILTQLLIIYWSIGLTIQMNINEEDLTDDEDDA
jgi:hypothetical protein